MARAPAATEDLCAFLTTLVRAHDPVFALPVLVELRACLRAGGLPTNDGDVLVHARVLRSALDEAGARRSDGAVRALALECAASLRERGVL